MDQFYLTLPSNSSMNFFPKNTLSTYKTKLAKELELQNGQWEVGLSEIQYPHKWMTLTTEKEGRIRMYHKVGEPTYISVSLGPGYYSSVTDLLGALNLYTTSEFATFSWYKHREIVLVSISPGKEIRLNSTLAEILHLPEKLCADPKTSKTYRSAGRVTDLQRGKRSLYVYCDLIQHQLVGDSSVPLLRIVPVRGTYGGNVVRTYNDIHYMPARGGTTTNVEINIRDDTGEPIAFDAGRVVVILHVRRRRSPYFPG